MGRSDSAFWTWSESAEKFDYYLCGLIAAVAAFTLRDLGSLSHFWSPPGVEMVSVLLLLSGVALGLKRIEATIEIKLLQHRRLYCEETRGKLGDPRLPALGYNAATGDMLSAEAREAEWKRASIELELLRGKLDARLNRAGLFYRWRNRVFLIGVLGLVIAKIWAGRGLP